MEILVFPDYLRGEKYKNRCVTFYACESMVDDTVDTSQALRENAKTVQTSETGNGAYAAADVKNQLAGSITLPFPNSLTDSQQHQWTAEQGLLNTVLGMVGNHVMTKTKDLDTAIKNKTGKNTNIHGALQFAKNNYSKIADAFAIRKIIPDPGLFQNYTGSTPRSFTFSYSFVPMSPSEAQTISSIIKWFKYYSSPEFETFGVAMKAPHIFSVVFSGNTYITEMFNMKRCVMTSLNVDYGADGAFSLYQDGFPKQINLSMTFAEMRITYAQEYNGVTIE